LPKKKKSGMFLHTTERFADDGEKSKGSRKKKKNLLKGREKISN